MYFSLWFFLKKARNKRGKKSHFCYFFLLSVCVLLSVHILCAVVLLKQIIVVLYKGFDPKKNIHYQHKNFRLYCIWIYINSGFDSWI